MDVLMVPPPDVSLELAQQVVAQVYGWQGPVRLLSGERDTNFVVRRDPDAPAMLKFINAAEHRQETDLQVRVLNHLSAGCSVPVPHALRCLQGHDGFDWVSSTGQTYRGRAYSYLDGVPMVQVKESTGLRKSVGRATAQLAQSLQGFAHPALERVFLWNVLRLGQLAPWVQALPEDDVKTFVSQFISYFEAQTLPRLRALPEQAQHGDLSKSNLLVAPDGVQIAGVLDFGDMALAARVVDLGIAASYMADEAGDGEEAMCAIDEVVQGYERIAALTAQERELVLEVVLARLVQRIVIPEWRAQHFPQNRSYILRSNAQARRLLRQLMPAWVAGAVPHLLKWS